MQATCRSVQSHDQLAKLTAAESYAAITERAVLKSSSLIAHTSLDKPD